MKRIGLAYFARMDLNGNADSNRRKYIAEEVGKFGKGNISAQAFTFQELNDTTQKFNPDFLLGEGGFGKVYKGHLETKNIVPS